MLITFIFTSAQVCLIVLFCRKFYLCDSKYTQSVQVLFNRCSCWEMISQYISIVTANTESRNVLKILLYTRFCAWLIQHWFVNAENKCTLIQPSNLFTIRVFFFFCQHARHVMFFSFFFPSLGPWKCPCDCMSLTMCSIKALLRPFILGDALYYCTWTDNLSECF